MVARSPTVSAVIIFFNEERFLDEAIRSVFHQTFHEWELLLVDDGSTDASSTIARVAADLDPDRVRYLEHPGRANRGMSASRNAGIAAARGRYLAFLDGDDVWLPTKLERQLEMARCHPDAAMIVAPLLRWHTWTGEPDAADLEDLMGVGRRKFGRHPYAGRLVEAPRLARLMLRDDYFIPSGALLRRDVVNHVGRYDEAFRTLYEDAVVMMKIASTHPVYVDDQVLYLYRMHPDSSTNVEFDSETIDRKRKAYLDAVEEHLESRQLLSPPMARSLRQARRSSHRSRHRSTRLLATGRRLGRRTVPRPLRDGLRRRWRNMTRPEVVR